MRALLTRGFLIDFEPSNQEVISILEQFADDKEIFNYIVEHESNLKDLNFRTYLKSLELKKAGIDWKGWVNSEYSNTFEDELIKEIMHLEKKKRDSIWIGETGKSVRTLRRKIKNRMVKRTA